MVTVAGWYSWRRSKMKRHKPSAIKAIIIFRFGIISDIFFDINLLMHLMDCTRWNGMENQCPKRTNAELRINNSMLFVQRKYQPKSAMKSNRKWRHKRMEECLQSTMATYTSLPAQPFRCRKKLQYYCAKQLFAKKKKRNLLRRPHSGIREKWRWFPNAISHANIISAYGVRSNQMTSEPLALTHIFMCEIKRQTFRIPFVGSEWKQLSALWCANECVRLKLYRDARHVECNSLGCYHRNHSYYELSLSHCN